jgi:hypothetical protein
MAINYADLAQDHIDGKTKYTIFRKVPTVTTGAGIWFDLSMSPGIPSPNYYVGALAAATQMVRTPAIGKIDGGIDHGPDVSPDIKQLLRLMVMVQTPTTAVPLPMILADYLMCYAFIAQDAGDQAMTNVNTLPRYTTGAGVQVMPILVGAQVGGTQFYITYTNSNGQSGRVSQTVTCNTQTVNGTLLTTAPGTAGAGAPFIPLQAGDTGVRSIESVTYLASDIGLMTLVLVKPLATINVYDISAPSEVIYPIDKGTAPVIVDDAFLGLICCPSGTIAAANIIGEMETVWS